MYRRKPILLLKTIFLGLLHSISNVTSETASGGFQQNVTVSVHSHKNDIYDVTTIYRLKNIHINIDNVGFKDDTFLTVYNELCVIEIHSRTNAIGMPIMTTDDKIDRLTDAILKINIPEFYERVYFVQNNNNRLNVSFESLRYWKKIKINLTGQKCESDEYPDSTPDTINNAEHKFGKCYNAVEYRYEKQYYITSDFQIIFMVHWSPTIEQTCLSITYFHRSESDMEIKMNIYDENNSLIISTKLEKDDDIQTLKISNMVLVRDRIYELLVTRKYYYKENYYGYNGYYGNLFGLLQISQCSDHDEEIRIVSINEIGGRPKPFNVLGNENIQAYRADEDRASAKVCLNGGYTAQSTTNKSTYCVCPPGFIGQFCEMGCGPNVYGANCKGICSTIYPNKTCRGVFMCTQYGCTCPAGLTGPLCNEDCLPGEYGADCKQICSSNCYNNTCDQYTGICSQGCSSPGYSPPFCLETPRTPNNVNKSDIGEIYVTLQWDIPWIFNGVLKMFIVNVEQISAVDMNTRCSDIGPIEIPFEKVAPYAYNIIGLKPGWTYSIGVMTMSKSLWYSSPIRIRLTTLLDGSVFSSSTNSRRTEFFKIYRITPDVNTGPRNQPEKSQRITPF